MDCIDYSTDPLSDDSEGPDPWADDYLDGNSDHGSQDGYDSWDEQEEEVTDISKDGEDPTA